MRLRIALYLLLLCALVCMTGCWDRKEINDMVFVSATSVDLHDDKYFLTVQFPLVGQMGGAGSSGGGGGTGGQKPWHMETAAGRTISEANANQQKSLSRILNFSHRRVLVLSEEFTKSGIREFLDILGRIPQNRMSAFLMATEGEAYEILNADSSTEKVPAEMLRELVVIAYQQPVSIEKVVATLLSEGRDPYLPYLGLDKNVIENKPEAKKKVRLKGIALFRDSKQVKVLKGESASGLLLALGQAATPVLTVKAPEGSGYISARLNRYDVEMIAKPKGRHPKFTLTLEGIVMLTENNSTFRASKDNRTIRLTEQALNQYVERVIRSGIEETQKSGVDPIGFGNYLYRNHPSYWRSLKSEWRDVYKQADITIKSRISFEHPGTMIYPLGIPDDDLVPQEKDNEEE